ncbi:hypothetical protein IV203_027824 [Nitzschia inconspicua]|uniref:Uncharacterized protein n=1 Tax=Nitzschia inconspicua TaxID=303405 RepID=A0A9K3Q3U1_9STRA|nr:hypothetical protein IV203_027824 [Nitzschia inconspicua]
MPRRKKSMDSEDAATQDSPKPSSSKSPRRSPRRRTPSEDVSVNEALRSKKLSEDPGMPEKEKDDNDQQETRMKTPAKRRTPSGGTKTGSSKKKKTNNDLQEKLVAKVHGGETTPAVNTATSGEKGVKSTSSGATAAAQDDTDDKMEPRDPLQDENENTAKTSLGKKLDDAATPKSVAKKRREKMNSSKKVDGDARSKGDNQTLAGQKRKKETITSTSTTITKSSNKNEAPSNKPTMDVYIHRLRHLQYHPAAVTAMVSTRKDGYVAVARQDGSFQLKVLGVLEEFRNKFIPHLVTVSEIPPPIVETPAIVANSLCWVETNPENGPPTCVAASATGSLWIIDFERSQMTSAKHSGGGGVFDMVTCGGNNNVTGTSGIFSLPMFAAACQDGSVRIWKVANSKQDVLLGGENRAAIVDPPLVTVPSMGAPVLSVAWKLCGRKELHSTKLGDAATSGKSTLIQTLLFAAVADGTIRKFCIDIVQHSHDDLDLQRYESEKVPLHDYTVDKVNSTLRMTVESKGRVMATKVWSLKVLDDGTLIAGNSIGQVQFWNSQTGTLHQTVLQTSLQSDVLKIVANDRETKVFCSGVDSRVVCIERQAKHTSGAPQWKLTHVQRPHTHDVKAMVLLPGEEYKQSSNIPRRLETLITGGVDTKLCSYMVSAFGGKRPQSWLPWPMQSPISTSSNPSGPRLLSMQRRDRIELYELEKLPDSTMKNNQKHQNSEIILPLRQSVKKLPSTSMVGSILLDSNTTDVSSRLLASQISPTGKFLAVSTSRSVLVFSLNRVEAKHKDDLEFQPIKVNLPKIFHNITATVLQFWGNVLYVGDSTKRQIHIVHLKVIDQENDEELKVISLRLPQVKHVNKGEVKLPLQSIDIGRNGNTFVVTSHTRDNAVHVFKRESDDVEYHHDWTLPKIGAFDTRPAASIVVMKYKLAVATYQSHVYLFNVKNKRLSSWSERHGFPIKSEKWTEDLLCRKDFPVRLMENPKDKSQIIIASFGTFCVMSLQKQVPRYCRSVPERHIRRRQYKAPEENDSNPWIKPRVSKPVTDDEENEDKDGKEAEALQLHEPTLEQESKKQKLDLLSKPYHGSHNCIMCLQYNGMLYLNFVSQHELGGSNGAL